MDAEQFQTFLQTLTAGLAGIAGPQNNNNQGNVARIAVKIPSYKGTPEENVMTWMLQVQNIFAAQKIEDEQLRIHYAATGFEGAALHWYLNRVQAANTAKQQHVFTDWATFANALRTAFQPPNHQQYLRQQLKKLRQTGSVQEYGMQFRNLLGQIEGMGDFDQVAYFIDGLKPATQMEVSYQAPTDFETAWTLAI